MNDEIEVFRADTRASRGITAAQIAEVAEGFAGNLPLCFGHPESDTPAAGVVDRLIARGSSLFAKITPNADAVDGIKSGKWRAPSMAFFSPNHEANPRPGKWTARHLALLGAAAPGIPGLAFNANDELTMDGAPGDAVVFAAAPTPVKTVYATKEQPVTATVEKTPEQIAAETEFAAREQRLKDAEDAHAARVKTQFEAGNSSAIDALVREGKVLPAEADGLKMAFNALDPEGEELTFGAGDKASKSTAVTHLFTFMTAALGKRVPLGGRESPATAFNATGEAPTTATDFNARVTALAKEKGLTFEAAAELYAEQIDA